MVMITMGIGSLLINLVMIIHLGMNPIRGGSPPIDKKLIMINEFIFEGRCIERDRFEEVILFILVMGMMVR